MSNRQTNLSSDQEPVGRVDASRQEQPMLPAMTLAEGVDDICLYDLPSNFVIGRLFLDEEQHIGLAFQEAPEVFLDVFPILFGIRTCGGDKKKLWIFLGGESNDFPINRSGPPGSYLTATDRNNRLPHFCLSLTLKQAHQRFLPGTRFSQPRLHKVPDPTCTCPLKRLDFS